DPICSDKRVAVMFKGTRVSEGNWFEGGALEGKTGYVRSVLVTTHGMGSTATVHLDEPVPTDVVYPPVKYLVPVEPERGDKVLILNGRYKGQIGVVNQKDDSSACVVNLETTFVDARIEQLAKIHSG